jgi:hypothetical protein
LKELLHRAAPIEKILEERMWRETSSGGEVRSLRPGEGDTAALTPIMSEIFYGAAKVLLASVVHGPYPRGELLSLICHHNPTVPPNRQAETGQNC